MDKIAVATLLATLALAIPVVACERIDPTRHTIGRIWTLLRRLLYPHAAAVTVQTESVSKKFGQLISGMNLQVVPNPISVMLAERAPMGDTGRSSRQRLVAIGRLTPQKGFDLLLDAFLRVARDFPTWDLWIWGEGEERQRLETQIASLGLERRAFLPGQTDSAWDEMEGAEIVAVPSRYEGMPNVMLEAMALGRAVVAFDCESGPREISDNGKGALLVPPENVEALASALQRLMTDEAERRRLGKAALSVRDRYSMQKVLLLWESLFSKMGSARSSEKAVR
jgi:glycosyltransferase involved in cell wall biosynthesis